MTSWDQLGLSTCPAPRAPSPAEGLRVWLADPAHTLLPHIARSTPQRVPCGKAERMAGSESSAQAPGGSWPPPGTRPGLGEL